MNTTELGKIISTRRTELNLTQSDLSLTSGTGVRFISDLENGKATCQVGKILSVLKTLGLEITIKTKEI